MPSHQLHTDQTGRQVDVQIPAKRIVSLVPSQTELLHDLGLEDEVVGITKFCVHPEHWFKTKARIGGTKSLHTKRILELKPDLVIANKEENVQEQINELSEKVPVWVSDVHDLVTAYQMMETVAYLTGKQKEASALMAAIQQAFDKHLGQPQPLIPACYLIWNDPVMTVGGDTFISKMMSKAGFENVFATAGRYPVVTPEQIRASGCKLLLLSSEPFPFNAQHAGAWEKSTGIKPLLVDGEMFSWYGSRLLQAPAYLARLRSQVATIC